MVGGVIVVWKENTVAKFEFNTELVDRGGNITISGRAVLWGVPLDPSTGGAFERLRLADEINSGTVSDALVQQSIQRAEEADANTGKSVLHARLEYWAEKDYGGHLREQNGTIVMVWVWEGDHATLAGLGD